METTAKDPEQKEQENETERLRPLLLSFLPPSAEISSPTNPSTTENLTAPPLPNPQAIRHHSHRRHLSSSTSSLDEQRSRRRVSLRGERDDVVGSGEGGGERVGGRVAATRRWERRRSAKKDEDANETRTTATHSSKAALISPLRTSITPT